MSEAPASAGGASDASVGEAGAARSAGAEGQSSSVQVAAPPSEQPAERASHHEPSTFAEATADKRTSHSQGVSGGGVDDHRIVPVRIAAIQLENRLSDFLPLFWLQHWPITRLPRCHARQPAERL